MEVHWEEVVEDFANYCKNKYSLHYARKLRYYVKHVPRVLENPEELLHLPPRTAGFIVETTSALNRWLKLQGYPSLDRELEKLKRFCPRRPHTPRFVTYFFGDDIIEEALRRLESAKLGKTLRFVAATAILTGLRGPELRYMFTNWCQLAKRNLDGAVAVLLNYVRKTKNAWITLMPGWHAEDCTEMRLGVWFVNKLQEGGVNISLARKAHVAMLSGKLTSAEIDVLQGRCSSMIVQHYIVHLPQIARRYLEAIKPYESRIRRAVDA